MKITIEIRKIVRDVFTGLASSIHKAYRGLTFCELRDFNSQSDPASAIDIRASVKRGKWMVKLTEAERSFTGLFIIDVSPSMFDIATQAITKRDFALSFIDAISCGLVEKSASVGAVLFAVDDLKFIQPRFGHDSVDRLMKLVRTYRPANKGKETWLSPALEFVAREKKINKPSLIFIISDGIFSKDDQYRDKLASLSKKHDVVVIIMRDKCDCVIPAPKFGSVCLRDVETGELVRGNGINNDTRLADTCQRLGIVCDTFITSDSEITQWCKLTALFARHTTRRLR